jgi:hypothetical protein
MKLAGVPSSGLTKMMSFGLRRACHREERNRTLDNVGQGVDGAALEEQQMEAHRDGIRTCASRFTGAFDRNSSDFK